MARWGKGDGDRDEGTEKPAKHDKVWALGPGDLQQ